MWSAQVQLPLASYTKYIFSAHQYCFSILELKSSSSDTLGLTLEGTQNTVDVDKGELMFKKYN